MTEEAKLSKLIAEAVEEARQQGLDYIGQMERAMRVVRAVRTDLTADDAFSLVQRLRQS